MEVAKLDKKKQILLTTSSHLEISRKNLESTRRSCVLAPEDSKYQHREYVPGMVTYTELRVDVYVYGKSRFWENLQVTIHPIFGPSSYNEYELDCRGSQ
mmetsp:Transcript_26341/g.30180  ORF Transcript_26341/g.30180 Transcript_26341/m.30180 type:complete len:99 (+) Transcript_26341:706-1002(+)